MSIFIDTNIFVALRNENDINHEKSKEIKSNLNEYERIDKNSENYNKTDNKVTVTEIKNWLKLLYDELP